MNVTALKEITEKLSPAPRVAAKLAKLLRNPDTHNSEIIAVVRVDPALTVRVIKACNSVFHKRGEEVATIDDAVHRLGHEEIYRFVSLSAVRSAIGTFTTAYDETADALWERSVLVACAMEELSRNQEGDPADCYTIGLLHLIGAFLLAPLTQAAGVTLHTRDEENLVREQRKLYDLTYTEVGALALEAWGFPAEVSLPIKYQLAPAQAGIHAAIAHRLNLAISIAHSLQGSLPGGARSSHFLQQVLLDASGPMHPLTGKIQERAKLLVAAFNQ